MSLLGVETLIAERQRFMETVGSLTPEEFETGTTLCSAWSPRDVLAHLIGTDAPVTYLQFAGRVNPANARVVAAARSLPRAELLARGERWAASPSASSRALARFLIGDVSVHHQDVVRGLGRTRELPPEVAGAIFREGVILSTGTKRSLLRYRVEPTTLGGHSLGRGRRVRGTTEAIGLWLAGRKGLETELDFG
ncbi:maleylpyruvate isomerase family mycothiol-dependent enzyme [Jatrophihabitans sp.]|uniref:maleylpyruvate isomerase family mycothiol-dependent enzyme n=1 Tax=Jatrophihabitans sp. TaxID=1932789 RepID=UPI0030C669C4|nr:hypothetical protein [Jatrophihabitans sp.]